MDVKSKIKSLQAYVDRLRHRLDNLPDRYKGHTQYIAWLNREIAVHSSKIDALKLEAK